MVCLIRFIQLKCSYLFSNCNIFYLNLMRLSIKDTICKTNPLNHMLLTFSQYFKRYISFCAPILCGLYRLTYHKLLLCAFVNVSSMVRVSFWFLGRMSLRATHTYTRMCSYGTMLRARDCGSSILEDYKDLNIRALNTNL